jgi:outer membrane protein
MTMFTRQISIAVVLGLAAFCAQAEESRIGYISTDRIFKESTIAKQAQAKLEQEFSKREKDLIEAEKSFKSAVEKFEREAPTLSESQRLSRQKQLGEQDRDFQRKRREFQEELGARKNEEMQQLVERANRVIKQFGDAEKFDLIVEGALYINPKHDITDKVLKAINAAK